MSVDINIIKSRLLVKYPFFGSIVANLNYVESKNCETMGTDGENVYYNSEYLKNQTEDEQTFLFAHEVCHVAFDHISRSRGKDIRVWNIASDAVINAFLQKDGLAIVKGAISIPGAINYNVEELYFKLLNEKKNGVFNNNYLSENNFEASKKYCDKKDESNLQQGNKTKEDKDKEKNIKYNKEETLANRLKGDLKSNENEINIDSENQEKNTFNDNLESKNDIGHDTHRMWKSIEEKTNQNNINEKEELEEDKQDGNINKDNKIDYNVVGKYDLKKDLKDAIKKISEIEEIDAFVQNTSNKKKNLEELKRSIIDKAIGAKNATIGANININKIDEYGTIINWKNLLRDAINYNYDWTYRNASIENGVLRANLEELQKPETEILLDTSGSINEVVLKNFLRECKSILRTSNVKVGCFDTKFYGFKEIRNEKDIEEIKLLGHGGTNYYVAVNAFTRSAENKIIFTDGKAVIPEKTPNIIWIVFGEDKININNGRVIYIRNEDLRKLYINKIA